MSTLLVTALPTFRHILLCQGWLALSPCREDAARVSHALASVFRSRNGTEKDSRRSREGADQEQRSREEAEERGAGREAVEKEQRSREREEKEQRELRRRFVTVTRRATAILNSLALEVLFAEAMPLGTVAVDPESNLENYDQHGRLIAMEPLQLPLFVGARVTLTKNIDKARDFVNGMGATVLGMKKSSVVVQTKTGHVLTVFPYRDEETSSVACLPLRLGYATTLQKIQRATLDHATIWLDVANIEAAGYVALSRVRRDQDWRFLGHLTPHHFTPASGV